MLTIHLQLVKTHSCLQKVLLIFFLLIGMCGIHPVEAAVPGSLSLTDFQNQFFNGMAPYNADLQELIVDANNRIVLMGIAVNPPNSITFREGYVFVAGNPMSLQSFSLGSKVGDVVNYAANFTPPSLLGNETKAIQFLFGGTGVSINNGHGELNISVLDLCKLANFYYDIDPILGKYGFGGSITLPLAGKGMALGVEAITVPNRLPVTSFNPTGSMLDLTRFMVEGEGLGIPLGDTGIAIDSLGMDIRNDLGLSLPQNWDNSVLKGSIGLETEDELVTSVPLYSFDGEGTWDIHHGAFEFNGTGKLFKVIPVNENSLKLDYPREVDAYGKFQTSFFTSATLNLNISKSGFNGSARGDLGIPSFVPLVGGFNFAGAEAAIHNSDFRGTVSIQYSPSIPSVCTPAVCIPGTCVNTPYPCWSSGICYKNVCSPQICTPAVCSPEIPAKSANVTFTFNFSTGDFTFSTGKKAIHANSWEVPYNEPVLMDGEMNATFMNDWVQTAAVTTGQRLQGVKAFSVNPQQGTPQTDFTIQTAVPAAIFRLNYANAAAPQVVMSLTLPNGTTVNLADGYLPFGFQNADGFSRFTPERREAYFCMVNPPLGMYRVTVGNPVDLGDFTVDLLQQTQPPRVELTSVQETGTPGVYTISWKDEDSDSPALIRIYLERDRQDLNGVLVASFDENDEVDTYTLDTRTLNVNPGYYYILLEAVDENHAPSHVYSTSPIHVINPNHPQPPIHVAAAPGDGRFQISWEPSESPDVTDYLILYSEDQDLLHLGAVEMVSADQRYAMVDGLKNGVPLLVTVVAMNADGLRSEFAEILRVIPQNPNEMYPPVIVSTPNPDATVGYLYSYFPDYFDIDFGTMKWELLQAPAGMNLDPSGLITWTPQANQVGTHVVSLRLTETLSAGQMVFATHEFVITVYPPDQIHGIESINHYLLAPRSLWAFEGTQYTNQVQLIGPNANSVEYILAEGPNGMTLNADGLISWNVPIGGDGSRVRILVVIDGEDVLEQDYFLHVHSEENSTGFQTSNVPSWDRAK